MRQHRPTPGHDPRGGFAELEPTAEKINGEGMLSVLPERPLPISFVCEPLADIVNTVVPGETQVDQGHGAHLVRTVDAHELMSRLLIDPRLPAATRAALEELDLKYGLLELADT